MKLNKFFSLLLVMFLFSYVSAFCTTAQSITINKINGGPHGFNFVSETHDIYGNHHLTCKEHGFTACEWNIKPPSLMSLPNNVLDDMINYANSQITAGVCNGTYWANFWFDNHCYSRSVFWSGTDTRNNNMQVNIMLLPD